ncbi:unnamed protein product [Notodromas monacha]|uniref:C2H2-type domain-containing protein n=1 Tax=Notodromas monacha TaxID=399045 RepID=A0A7R9BGB9_9CRUS|nr:unnamed protein product [Notodromas monacha]CAG0913919.1 unnamed protein product [Notodromas monacha]
MAELCPFSPSDRYSGSRNGFVCPVCEKNFLNPLNLSHHVEEKHRLKHRVKCGVCGLGFASVSGSLEGHIELCAAFRKNTLHQDDDVIVLKEERKVVETFTIEDDTPERTTKSEPTSEESSSQDSGIPMDLESDDSSSNAVAELSDAVGNVNRQEANQVPIDKPDEPHDKSQNEARPSRRRTPLRTPDRNFASETCRECLADVACTASSSEAIGIRGVGRTNAMWYDVHRTCAICRRSKMSWKHFETHCNPGAMRCPVCVSEKHYETKEDLQCHFNIHHMETCRVAFQDRYVNWDAKEWCSLFPSSCRICGHLEEFFANWYEFQRHWEEKHAEIIAESKQEEKQPRSMSRYRWHRRKMRKC